jgi:hypothetical protein
MNPCRPVFYIDTLTALLIRPSRFFATAFQEVSAIQSLIVLTLSSIFFAATGTLIRPESASLTTGLILFVNAVGMAVLGSAAGYLAIAATGPRRYAFGQLFSIFSLSSGAVLLIAWVPLAFFITEPWKWWLIGTGMVNGLGMSKTRAAITMLFTFAAMVLLVYAVLPMVAHGPVQPA